MRTLNRPMFRSGGSTGTGVTSGLAPRQGYAHEPGHVVQNDPRKLNDMRASDLGKLTIGQMKELSRSPKGGDLSKFLIDFGLNVAGATPSGSILSTAARSAQEPYGRMQQAKASRASEESDMFATLFKGAADAQGEAKSGKGWLEQWKFQQIPILNKIIRDFSPLEEKGTITAKQQAELDDAKDYSQIEDDLIKHINLKPTKTQSDFTKSRLNSKPIESIAYYIAKNVIDSNGHKKDYVKRVIDKLNLTDDDIDTVEDLR